MSSILRGCRKCGHIFPPEYLNSFWLCKACSDEEDAREPDPVRSPSHYTKGGIETIDYIRAKLTKEEFIGYCMGNVIKYTSRYKDKNGEQDLKKAGVYLEWALERMGQE